MSATYMPTGSEYVSLPDLDEKSAARQGTALFYSLFICLSG